MDFKKIAHAAVCRWNEKRHTDKTSDTHRTSLPEAAPAVREVASLKAASLESSLGDFLAERYEFRFNVLTEATEFRSKSDKGNGIFRPATERDLNAICLEAHRHGIDCWDRDVARMVYSADVREYHPFRQYFQRLPAWDGRDRLHGLAARVSDSPLWVQAFHRWMLGLAAQWAGLSDGLHAHSTAPLLVSDEQGLGKSTFCRALLPPELQAYYTDSVDLARPDKVERQLTEMGLLNLDEFDRIPEKKHPLLKNLMQQPAQGVPAAQPSPAAHRLLHRHVQLARTAFRPFGKPPLHLRARGASHRQHGYRPCANLRPTEGGTGKRGTVLVQPRGRERPAVAQRGFLPHLPGRGSVAPLLSCGSAEREGTPALSARDIRTVAAVGTRSDGRCDAAETGSSPRSRRSAESAHALRKPIQGGGKVMVGI
jgi:hypothetical protein